MDNKHLFAGLGIVLALLILASIFIDSSPSGATLNARSMKDKAPQCQTNEDCGGLESCLNGSCVPVGQQEEGGACNQDDDCSLGMECVGGTCEQEQGFGQEGDPCVSDAFCASGFTCIDDACTALE